MWSCPDPSGAAIISDSPSAHSTSLSSPHSAGMVDGMSRMNVAPSTNVRLALALGRPATIAAICAAMPSLRVRPFRGGLVPVDQHVVAVPELGKFGNQIGAPIHHPTCLRTFQAGVVALADDVADVRGPVRVRFVERFLYPRIAAHVNGFGGLVAVNVCGLRRLQATRWWWRCWQIHAKLGCEHTRLELRALAFGSRMKSTRVDTPPRARPLWLTVPHGLRTSLDRTLLSPPSRLASASS